MRNINLFIPLIIWIFFWGCTEHSSIGIEQHTLDEPDSKPTITESNYTDGRDFSEGYYNGKIRSDQVTLSWETSLDTNFLGYKIFRALGGGPASGDLSYFLVETLNNQNSPTFIDTLLTQDQYYTYKVATIVKQGTHKVDNFAIKTPMWQAPSNVIANGLNPEIVELHWDDNSESETEFKIYICTMGGNLCAAVDSTTVDRDDTTNVISGLSENAMYQFSLKAINNLEEDTQLAYSPLFTFRFDAPTSLVASQISGTKAVGLIWIDNSTLENSFKIERDTGIGFALLATVDVNSTSYTDTDTTDFEYDNTYTYRIRAYNNYSGTVFTDFSNETSVTLSE